MLPLIGTVFIASLFGSLHCVGMCGPLAILASSRQSRSHKNHRHFNAQAVVAYHGSRIIAYAIFGGIVGLLGAAVQETGAWFGLQRLAARLAGGSMLVMGLLAIVRLAGGTSHTVLVPAWLQRWLARGHAWARNQKPVPRAATIGLLTAILPCGWLFAFLIVAAGTASMMTGAIVMATFALGSVPALAGLAMSMTLLIGRFRSVVPWCSAVLVTFVGAVTLLSRSQIELESLLPAHAATHLAGSADLSTTGRPVHAHTGSNTSSDHLTSATTQVQAIDHKSLPCCCQEKGECEVIQDESALSHDSAPKQPAKPLADQPAPGKLIAPGRTE